MNENNNDQLGLQVIALKLINDQLANNLSIFTTFCLVMVIFVNEYQLK